MDTTKFWSHVQAALRARGLEPTPFDVREGGRLAQQFVREGAEDDEAVSLAVELVAAGRVPPLTPPWAQ